MSEQQRYPGLQKQEIRKFNETQIGNVRDIELDVVFVGMGATPDPKDQYQWRSAEGHRISTGHRKDKASAWNDHDAQKGGYGAIDLAMHLGNMEFKEAMKWLGAEAPKVDMVNAAILKTRRDALAAAKNSEYILPPEPVEKQWGRVKTYLIGKRKLNEELIDRMHIEGKIYADRFANAVFLSHNGKSAELRGTGEKPYHGVRGVEKHPFSIKSDDATKKVAFVESAIESLSLRSLGFNGQVIGYAGQSREAFAKTARYFHERGFEICAAFNNDKDGNRMANNLAEDLKGISVKRETPLTKDWNDDLKAKAAEREATRSSKSQAQASNQR